MSNLEERFQKAIRMEASGRIKEALVLYRELDSELPGHPLIQYHIGTALLRLGDLQGCRQAYRISLKGDPQQPQIYSNLGTLEAQAGNLGQARDYFSRAIALSPEYAFAWNNHGNVTKDQGDAISAIRSYQRATLISNVFPDAYYNQGILYRGLGDRNKALDLFKLVIRQNPGGLKAYGEQVSILLELEEINAAFEHCKRAITIHPEYSTLYSQLAYISQLKGDMAGSCLLAMKSAFLSPKKQGPYLILAFAEAALGHNSRAQRRVDVAASLAPDSSEVWHGRGQVLKVLRQFEAAIVSYERSILNDPSNALSYLAKAKFRRSSVLSGNQHNLMDLLSQH
jgi:tetratricopeptide (TPR) repeat protein